jgi:hypothetical protein
LTKLAKNPDGLNSAVATARSLANRAEAFGYRIRLAAVRWWPAIVASLLAVTFAAGAIAMALFDSAIGRLLGSQSAIEPVADLLLQMGAALIGATTIAFTLVMFAMQVNVERMPYGLFRRFGADPPLMSTFGLTFLLSISVAVASLVRSAQLVPWLLFGLAGTTVAILGLFLFAYRRALKLINPAEQLGFVVRGAQRDLAWWDRRAALAARRLPLKGPPPDGDRDHARIAFFLANPRWTETARKAVEHAVAYARRYAEASDYDVCLVAFNGVVAINRAYIRAKGRSFVPTSPFFEIPDVDDGFLTHSLEELRQFVDVALARADERQTRLGLEACSVLCGHYAAVDYGASQTMTHAHLAMGYLTGAVQSVVPHGMTDVVMAGARYIGQAAWGMIARDGALHATSGIEALGAIGETMARKPEASPAAQVVVGQLADITSGLLLSPPHRGRLALQSTVEAMMRVSHGVLAQKVPRLGRLHSTTLAAYFGLTSLEGLVTRLTAYTNSAFDEAADPTRIANYAESLLEWVEVLRAPLKTLLLTSITMRSSLTFDLVSWISQVAEVLLGLATADHCPEAHRNRLEREGVGMGQLFTWIPEDAGMLEHCDLSNLTEQLFLLVVMARRRDSDKGVLEFARLLVGWTFKASCVGGRWPVLQSGLTGLAVLSLKPDGPYDPNGLKLAILDEIGRRKGSQAVFDEAAEHLRGGHRQGLPSFNAIANATDNISVEKLDGLLREIADLLSPPARLERATQPAP